MCLLLAHGIYGHINDYEDDYYDTYYDTEPQDCSAYEQYQYRCVRKDHCQTNKLTVKADNSLIEAQAELGLCPDDGECYNEINVIRDCSDPEFKNEGFRCVEKAHVL